MRDSAAACRRYLERIPFVSGRRNKLMQGADDANADTAMADMHGALSDGPVDPRDPAEASYEHRLETAVGAGYAPQARQALVRDAQGRMRLSTGPVLNRSSMIPRRWPPKFWQVKSWWHRRPRDRRADSPDPLGRWHRAGAVRRSALGLLVLVQTILATDFMTAVLPTLRRSQTAADCATQRTHRRSSRARQHPSSDRAIAASWLAVHLVDAQRRA